MLLCFGCVVYGEEEAAPVSAVVAYVRGRCRLGRCLGWASASGLNWEGAARTLSADCILRVI